MNPSIKNFIEASKKVEAAKYQLWAEQSELAKAREALTKAFFGPDGRTSDDIPESFVIQYEGKPYLIRVDVEGDHAHTIERIGAIIEAEAKNTTTYGQGTTCECGHLNYQHGSAGCAICECREFTWIGRTK